MEKRIKSITITQFDYIIRNVNDEELDIHGHPHHFTEFDPEGRMIREVKYNRLGNLEEMVEYGYDTNGNLIRESYYPEENELAEEKLYERNESGQIVRAFKNYQDGSVDTITYDYDQSGQLVKKTTTSDEGEIDQVEKFEWDNGTLIGHEILDGEGENVSFQDENPVPAGETRTRQNAKNQVISEEELDENGDVYMTVNRSYDENDNAEEVEVFIDGRGHSISRHYFLKYGYVFYD
ncbi:MAG: hypothetical protein WCK34_02030 [Bacteroidota bacterium]